MDNIVISIKQKEAFMALQSASQEMIEAAEERLKVRFSKEYRDYIAEFGAASFYGHELTGICGVQALDVVAVTEMERKLIEPVADSWYVIEQAHIDGIVIWQTDRGEIYQTIPNAKPIKKYNSLLDYINAQ